ncbi:MAG: ImmA/IrrE family metallo-endopeptidase [Proteobacteria bacterium]|nr:ImmA/IrrE family metallo-endopeptidase [Pseudomonadota bacterium]
MKRLFFSIAIAAVVAVVACESNPAELGQFQDGQIGVSGSLSAGTSSSTELSGSILAQLLASTTTSLDVRGVEAQEPRGDVAVISYHWAALRAIKVGNHRDSEHYVRHIIEVVQDEHLEAMEYILKFLEDGESHLAEHGIEQMLVGKADPKLSEWQAHLQLTYFAWEQGEIADAIHHLEHVRWIQPSDVAEVLHVIASGAKDDIGPLIARIIGTAVDRDYSDMECVDQSRVIARTDVAQTLELIVDQSLTELHGGMASYFEHLVINQAQLALDELGVSFELLSRDTWESGNLLTIREISDSLYELFGPPLTDSIRIVFTDIDLEGTENGVYMPENRTIVVVHDHKDHARDRSVLAHEIGHSLGLLHRPGTYMQPHGFPLVPVWSDCQKLLG